MEKVVASLKIGAIYTGLFLGFLYGIMILLVLLGCVMLLIPFFMDFYQYYGFICGAILAYILTVLVFICIMINHKNCKLVKKWSEDAVLIKAQTKSIGDAVVFSGAIPIKVEKMLVIFEYDGKLIKKESGSQRLGFFSSMQGYSALFRKYVNREINILYSPRYDEVMILKA